MVNSYATNHAVDASGPRLLYLTARWQLMDVSATLRLFDSRDRDWSFERVSMGAVSRLPLALQVAFRRKMFVIFALQLLAVTCVCGVFRWSPSAKQLAAEIVDAKVALWIFAAAASALALLSALVTVRKRFPLNWFVLVLFTAAQSGVFVAVGVRLDSDLVVLNSAFSLVGVVVMTALCSVQRRREVVASLPQSLADAVAADTKEGEDEQVLSTLSLSLIAYVAACIVFLCAGGWRVLGDPNVAYSMLFQLALALWFAVDVASMHRAMSPDEYMLGVINFYIDLVLLAIITAIVTALIMACLAFEHRESSGRNDNCDCDCSLDSNSPCCGPGDCECVGRVLCECCVRGCDLCYVVSTTTRADDTPTARAAPHRDEEEEEEEEEQAEALLVKPSAPPYEDAMDRV
jgi:FtsH-binding integral membrane protein